MMTDDELKREADKLIAEEAVANVKNPAKQARITAIYKQLYPGQIPTAALDRGDGFIRTDR